MQRKIVTKQQHPPSSSDAAKPLLENDPCQDVRQLSEALKMNESRLELAAEAANAGFWSLDLATDALWVNNMMREIFEFPADIDITFQLFIDKVHPEDLAELTTAMQRALAGEKNVSVEYRIMLPDGSLRWIHSRGGLYLCNEGSTSCLMGASVDITERKSREQSLARQLRFEALFAEISTSMANFMLPADLDSQIEYALGRITDYFDGDRCGLIEFDLKKRETRITHAFHRDGMERVPPDTDLVSLFPWSVKQVTEGCCFFYSDLDDLPPDADVDRRSWLATGVISALHVPLRVNDTVLYLFLVQSLTKQLSWEKETLARLQIIGEVFINAIYKKRVEEELRHSYNEIAKLTEKLEVEADYLRAEVRASRPTEIITGQSEPIRKVLALVEQVAPTSSTVLVCGETGTGKELVAQAIHNQSSRRDRLMVKVNCASLPSPLVESELFGREKGAYTGALTRQIGRFELASGSTLFLDEISEMSFELQAKLLRVLQDGEFERLGSPTTIKVDVRVIAATNSILLAEVAAGRFRNDLYYRLNVFPIVVPPLRERQDDIPMLVWEFVREFNEKMGKKIRKIADKDITLLQSYSWPGNIRELRNVIEYAVIISTGDALKVKLPENSGDGGSLRVTIAEMERRHIHDILRQTNWRIKGDGGAAKILGMNPSTLYFRMKKLGIASQRAQDD